MKKKIGIMTLHFTSNYGAVLQVYALLMTLKKLGFDAYVVDRRWDVEKGRGLFYYFKKYIFHFTFNYSFNRFRKLYLQPTTEKIDRPNVIYSKELDFDGFVVGSDQVWRIENTTGVGLNYFLDFAKDRVKKVSYAPSFGNDIWSGSDEDTKKIKSLLKNFDAISVREDSGVIICKDFFGIDAEQLVDPTLLLEAEEYQKICGSLKKSKTKYIANYYLDKSLQKMEILSFVSNNFEYPIKDIYVKREPSSIFSKPSIKLWEFFYPSVKSWINGIRNSEIVITDSFHGTIFSIVFKKKFICVANKKRGVTRMLSILKKLGLSNRLVYSLEDVKNMDLNEEIDYFAVHEIIKFEKNKSMTFLSKGLN